MRSQTNCSLEGKCRRALVIACVFVLSAPADEGPVNDGGAPPDLKEKTEVIANALKDIAPQGWKQTGPVERYVVANLYDKIDGRSELYMSYGVKGLAFVTLANQADTSLFIDIFLYDMSSVPGAYGIFSVERSRDQTPVTVGRGGYRTDHDLFFWKGTYYVSLLGSGTESPVRNGQKDAARRLADRLSDSEETPWGFEVLPKKDLITDSIRFFMVDALSLSFLKNTYTALYREDSEEISVFISRTVSKDEAGKLRNQYVEYMKKYGEQVEEVDSGSQNFTLADMGGGYYDVIFCKDAFLGGVTAVQDRSLALNAAVEFHKSLRTDGKKN